MAELQFLEWVGDLDQATGTAMAFLQRPDGSNVLLRVHLDGSPFTGTVRIGGRVLTYEAGTRIDESAAPKNTAQERAQERQDKLREAEEKTRQEREKLKLEREKFEEPLKQRAREEAAKRLEAAIKAETIRLDAMFTRGGAATTADKLRLIQGAYPNPTGDKVIDGAAQALRDMYLAQANEPAPVAPSASGELPAGTREAAILKQYPELARDADAYRQVIMSPNSESALLILKRIMEQRAQQSASSQAGFTSNVPRSVSTGGGGQRTDGLTDFERAQLAKGFVYYRGTWVSPQDYAASQYINSGGAARDQQAREMAALQKRLLEAQVQEAEKDLPANYLHYAGGAYNVPPARR